MIRLFICWSILLIPYHVASSATTQDINEIKLSRHLAKAFSGYKINIVSRDAYGATNDPLCLCDKINMADVPKVCTPYYCNDLNYRLSQDLESLLIDSKGNSYQLDKANYKGELYVTAFVVNCCAFGGIGAFGRVLIYFNISSDDNSIKYIKHIQGMYINKSGPLEDPKRLLFLAYINALSTFLYDADLVLAKNTKDYQCNNIVLTYRHRFNVIDNRVRPPGLLGPMFNLIEEILAIRRLNKLYYNDISIDRLSEDYLGSFNSFCNFDNAKISIRIHDWGIRNINPLNYKANFAYARIETIFTTDSNKKYVIDRYYYDDYKNEPNFIEAMSRILKYAGAATAFEIEDIQDKQIIAH